MTASRVWAYEIDWDKDGEPEYIAQWTPRKFYRTTNPEEAMLFARRSDAISILPMLDRELGQYQPTAPRVRVTPLVVDVSYDLV